LGSDASPTDTPGPLQMMVRCARRLRWRDPRGALDRGGRASRAATRVRTAAWMALLLPVAGCPPCHPFLLPPYPATPLQPTAVFPSPGSHVRPDTLFYVAGRWGTGTFGYRVALRQLVAFPGVADTAVDSATDTAVDSATDTAADTGEDTAADAVADTGPVELGPARPLARASRDLGPGVWSLVLSSEALERPREISSFVVTSSASPPPPRILRVAHVGGGRILLRLDEDRPRLLALGEYDGRSTWRLIHRRPVLVEAEELANGRVQDELSGTTLFLPGESQPGGATDGAVGLTMGGPLRRKMVPVDFKTRCAATVIACRAGDLRPSRFEPRVLRVLDEDSDTEATEERVEEFPMDVRLDDSSCAVVTFSSTMPDGTYYVDPTPEDFEFAVEVRHACETAQVDERISVSNVEATVGEHREHPRAVSVSFRPPPEVCGEIDNALVRFRLMGPGSCGFDGHVSPGDDALQVGPDWCPTARDPETVLAYQYVVPCGESDWRRVALAWREE